MLHIKVIVFYRLCLQLNFTRYRNRVWSYGSIFFGRLKYYCLVLYVFYDSKESFINFAHTSSISLKHVLITKFAPCFNKGKIS
jgi:hypothetical protein